MTFKSQRIPGTNIIKISLDKLEKLGYSKKKGIAKPGNLLCAASKSWDIWMELSKEDIKNSKINENIGKFLIYEAQS